MKLKKDRIIVASDVGRDEIEIFRNDSERTRTIKLLKKHFAEFNGGKHKDF